MSNTAANSAGTECAEAEGVVEARALFEEEVLGTPSAGLVVSLSLKARLLQLLATEDEGTLLLQLASWMRDKAVCPIS